MQAFNFWLSAWILTMKQEILNQQKVGPSDAALGGAHSLCLWGHQYITRDVAMFQTTRDGREMEA